MFKKGGLIEILSLPTKILNPTKVTNEIGSDETTYVEADTIQMYITSIENGGTREDVANKYDETRSFVGQTTTLNSNITINSLLEQGGKRYRVIEIDGNAANVAIEAEYKLERIGDLQDQI